MSNNSGYTGQGPPPLPPRSRPAASGEPPPAETPPPIPPRPPGFRYQPIQKPDNIYPEPVPSYPQQYETGSGQPRSFPPPNHADSDNSKLSANGSEYAASQHVKYTGEHELADISRHFPNGVIPPPPPGPPPSQGQGSEAPSSQYHVTSDHNSPPADQAHTQRAPYTSQTQESTTQYSSSECSPPAASEQSKGGVAQNLGATPDAQAKTNNPRESSNTTQESSAFHLNEQLRQLRIARVIGADGANSATSDGGSAATKPSPSSASSPPGASGTSSPFVPVQQSPKEKGTSGDSLPDPDAWVDCSEGFVNFKAKWYSHFNSPNYTICSYCYEEHIRGSPFRDQFNGVVFDDGKPRACRFSKPRMEKTLFPAAVVTGSLDGVIQFMVLRSSIADCQGQNFVKGTAGISWYRPKNNAVPPMVVCQACYEDRVLVHHEFAANFEPAHTQPADQAVSDSENSPRRFLRFCILNYTYPLSPLNVFRTGVLAPHLMTRFC